MWIIPDRRIERIVQAREDERRALAGGRRVRPVIQRTVSALYEPGTVSREHRKTRAGGEARLRPFHDKGATWQSR